MGILRELTLKCDFCGTNAFGAIITNAGEEIESIFGASIFQPITTKAIHIYCIPCAIKREIITIKSSKGFFNLNKFKR